MLARTEEMSMEVTKRVVGGDSLRAERMSVNKDERKDESSSSRLLAQSMEREARST